MTTNSLNPVDGDVRALIEHIKAVIDEYESFGAGGMDEQVYRIALATMTANPIAYTDEEQLTELHKSTFAEIYAPDDSFKGDGEWIPLYTTPPAQLLRPVELPKGRLMQVAFETDPVNADMCLCISRDAAVRAIQSAGGEVKE